MDLEPEDDRRPVTDDLPRLEPVRLVRSRIAQALLILVVLGTTGGILRVVVHTNVLIGRMTTDVAAGQQRATNLSDTQREALLLLQQVSGLGADSPIGPVTIRRGLLTRQLLVAAAVFPLDSPQYRELQDIRAGLTDFPWGEIEKRGRLEVLRATATALVSQIEVRVKTLYDAQEASFYQATLDSVDAKRASQNALVGLVSLVTVLGVCWIVLLKRRSRTTLAHAYDALVGEVGERRSAEKALRASEVRFRSLVQRASDLTVVTDAAGIASYLSPASKQILGHDPEELTGASMFEYTHPEDRPRAAHLFAELLRNPGVAVTDEMRATTRDGRVRTLEVLGRNLLADPAVAGIVWNARDVTDRRALQDQLSHQAFHDVLTGLPNRALFMRRMTEALQQAERLGGSVAVLLIDLDGFKNVNDTLGHPAGDELLQRAAERLRGCILEGDTLARLGGDEFAIVIPAGTPVHATAVGGRAITALRRPISAAGQEVRVSASIGVAQLEGHQTAEELLGDADIAMYAAKKSGKGRFQLFEQQMRDRTSERARLEQQLSRAVGLGQIEVWYQPVVDLASREITAVEALARWRHGDDGLIQPAVFIPIAEESGLIGEIGAEVLRQACETVQRWRRIEPGCANLNLAVNVSGWQILAADYSLQVADTLAATGLPAEALTLEITESMMLEDSDALSGELARLKALKVRLAMDDFGAGYSSLSSLLRFKVDTLKIDRMFLDVGVGSGQVSLVRAVAELGHTLGLTVVAEGVETAEHLAIVRAAGCDAVQGFLISKPLPEADARLVLEWAAASDEVSMLLSAATAASG
jgi:diguanylate cyclase (GGDEF)-like protein/PAS domain S-box-containing protein